MLLIERLECLPVLKQSALAIPSDRGDAGWGQQKLKIARIRRIALRLMCVVGLVLCACMFGRVWLYRRVPVLARMMDHLVSAGCVVSCASWLISKMWQRYVARSYAKHASDEVPRNMWLIKQVEDNLKNKKVNEAFEMLLVLNRNCGTNIQDAYRNLIRKDISIEWVIMHPDKKTLYYLCFTVAQAYARQGEWALALDLIPKKSREAEREPLLQIIKDECDSRIHEMDARQNLESLLPEQVLPAVIQQIIREFLVMPQDILRDVRQVIPRLIDDWTPRFSEVRGKALDPDLADFDGSEQLHCPKEEPSVTLWADRFCQEERLRLLAAQDVCRS